MRFPVGKQLGIIHTINDGLSDVVKADKLEVLYGRDYIIREIRIEILREHLHSFFQTNTFGAEAVTMVRRDLQEIYR